MEVSVIAAFAALAMVCVVSPGPNFILICSEVPRRGRGAGFAMVCGFAAASLVHGAAALLGCASLLAAWPLALQALTWLGAGYLAWIGGRALQQSLSRDSPVLLSGRRVAPRQAIALRRMPCDRLVAARQHVRAPVSDARGTRSGRVRCARDGLPVRDAGLGFATAFVYVHSIMAFIAMLPRFLPDGSPIGHGVSLVAVYITIVTLWFTLLATILSDRRVSAILGCRQVWLDRASGIGLIGAGVAFLW